MAFRRSGATSTELLLLLLVTEHPSSGVDPDELAGALDQAREVARTQARDESAPLALLGPTFSGSATSLHEQLRRWCKADSGGFCKTRDLVAVSGSATVRQTKPLLESLGPDVFASAAYHATVLPDDLLRAGMRRFLHERLNVADDEVADLTEASTDYGIDAGDQAVSQRLARRGGPGNKQEPARDPGPKIPFPMHVGVLANQAAKATSGTSEELPFVFDGDGTKKIALQLDSTFAALSRYGIRHVGIVASSTRDKIFLAEQFRQSAPNLRVHMYESSIDLADRSKRQGLEGVMVASSYPLFPMTQVWAGDSQDGLQQFPSMSAEGIYNAVLALLARANVGDGYARVGTAAGLPTHLRQPLPGGPIGLDQRLDRESPVAIGGLFPRGPGRRGQARQREGRAPTRPLPLRPTGDPARPRPRSGGPSVLPGRRGRAGDPAADGRERRGPAHGAAWPLRLVARPARSPTASSPSTTAARIAASSWRGCGRSASPARPWAASSCCPARSPPTRVSARGKSCWGPRWSWAPPPRCWFTWR